MNEHMSTMEPKRVISYARVSTGSQAATGLGIDAQHQAIAAASAANEWQVVEGITDEAVSGTVPPEERPGMSTALAQLDGGVADLLIATSIDRLGRIALRTLLLFDRSEHSEWDLITLDVPEGIQTRGGRLMVGFLAHVAEHVAGTGRDRTKAALQTARRNGTRLGRPSKQPQEARELAVALHAAGRSLREIAAALEVAGIRTATGKTTL